jgi:filamentous hemagglutinin family protein
MNYSELARHMTTWMLMGIFFIDPIAAGAAAPITADPMAPAAQQPLVQQTANGIPLVQLTAPTAGGVSRNQYQDFNVPATGAILNNAHGVTNTQLAGYVQGNPNMAGGTAKVIVNEVTGANRTQMNGFLEVAGDRAGVVIANPNGIAVNGGGFINTSHAMLTTGTPRYDANGGLSDLQVTGGTIRIDGNGLDGSKADSVAVLARAVQVNAGIWAKDASIIAGANNVTYNDLKAVPTEGTGEKPSVALDVAAIGGMYANRIFLVGTEKGLGVNMAGSVSASQQLSLENNGDLHIAKTGAVYSDGTLSVHTAGNITNEQTLASSGNMTLRADQGVTNTGVIGAGIGRDGAVNQPGRLTIQTTKLNTDNAQIVSGGDMAVTADSLSSQSGELSSQGNAVIHVTDAVVMEKGKITAGKDLSLTAQSLLLTGRIASGGNILVTAENSLTNENSTDGFGSIQAGGNLVLHTDGSLTNKKNIEGGGTVSIDAKTNITNTETGTINGNGVAVTAKDVNNTGLITAENETAITAEHLKNHETGRIYGDDVTITAGNVENRKNTELEEKLAQEMKTLTAKEQALDAAYAVDVTSFTTKAQEQGYTDTIAAAEKAYTTQLAVVQAVQQEMEQHKSAVIAARRNLSIQGADTVRNSADATLYSGGDMSITAQHTITNNGAKIDSMGNLSLTAQQVSNENNAFSAKRVGGAWTDNPDKIRIDQNGHPEQGQAFDKSEFTQLSSGYGAYHNTKAMEIYAPAYDIVAAPEPGETVDPAHPAGSKVANYEWNDAIFTTMGLTPMTSARPETAGANQTAWDTQFNVLLEQLNTKITEHNAKAEQNNANIGATEDKKIYNYTIIRSHSQTSHEEVQTTNAGVIRSGGNMTVTGNLRNENSQMSAGQTLSVTGKLENEAKENQELTTTFGTTQASYTYRRPRPHKARRRGYKSEVFMTPQVTKSNTYTLGVSSYENNSAARPDSQDITKTARDNANAFLDPFSLDTTGATVTPQQWKQAADKLTSSLYQLHPETTAKYLIETDPAFTNKKEFLSSDYMYDQMKWDPDKVPKRLGDGFYEQGLIRDQILNKSGQRYLDGYSDDMDEYKALMDAGVVYARETGLVPGVTLSAEQAAALTSDMVWLETKTIMIDGKPQTVVYPRVYLRANSAMTLHADGSLISAKQLLVDTKDAVVNQGILQGKTVAIQAGSIENTGRMQGNTIALSSDSSIHQGGLMTATDGVQLQAKQDITMDNTVDHLKNQDVLNRTAGIAVTGKDGVLLVAAGRDVNLAGATLQALGDKGAVVLQAGHDVNLTTQSLSAKKDMTLNKENYLRTQRQTEVGTTINADGGAAILANHDIIAKAAYINSDNGTVALQAGNDIVVTTGRQQAVDDYGLKHKESGMVSSTTTTVRTHDDHQAVLGTAVTGKTIQMAAGQDIHMTAATVVGQNDVNIAAGRNLTTTSDTQYDRSESYEKVTSSGIMGAGMGILIGTKKTKDTADGEWKTQVGTTIASSGGTVNLSAGDTAHLTTTDVIGQKGVNLTAQDVILDGKMNEAKENRTHEESQSGLTVSLSSPVISAAEGARTVVRTAQTRDNKTLRALELYEGGKDLRKNVMNMGKQGAGTVGVHVGLGSNSFKQEYTVDTQTYAGGSLRSNGAVNVIAGSPDANKGNIHATGETIQGQQVNLLASNDITLDAGTNRQTETNTYKSKGASIGATFTGGAVTGVDASFAKENSDGTTETVTHTGTTVIAGDTLTMHSGKDTNIIGSQVSGNTVKADIGGNLHIESLQDTETYRGHESSMGISVSYTPSKTVVAKQGKDTKVYKTPSSTSKAASWSKGKTTSDYASVTKQAGIYAGDGGYQIKVQDNTHLKGAVIASTAADYKSSGIGANYIKSSTAEYNEKGLTPNLVMPAKGNGSSTTKSAISPGTITIRENPNQNIDGLSRDTTNSLNKLGKIFDKKTVEERQELAGLFGKEANEAIHRISKQLGWKDGSAQKIALHAAVAGITAQMTGNSFASGAVAGGVNEAAIKKIMDKVGKDNPDVAQTVSAVLGYAANKAIGQDGNVGATVAWHGTKWNYFGDAHPGQKITRVAIGIDYTGHGHASLIVGFENGDYEEANYGRYGGDVATYSGYASPIGQGTYAFDYNYYLGKDNKTIYFLNVNANDVAYAYNEMIKRKGYTDIKQAVFIGMDNNSNYIWSGATYRMIYSASDYNLILNNCVTTSVAPVVFVSSKDNENLNSLSSYWIPSKVGDLFEQDMYDYKGSGLVAGIHRP